MAAVPPVWARGALSPAIRALALLLATAAARAEDDPARFVDPFIGTGGHGHTHPAATLPFGMVQLGPDTRLTGWDGASGYHDDDRVIHGFSHTHLSGTGIPDYGDVLFMPVTGAPGAATASRFDKTTERAEPGWYAVELSDHGVAVELTATERTGFHRYVFPGGRPGHVVVDLAHRDEVLDASLRPIGDREIEGHRRSTGWAKDQIVFFVARFSRPFVETAADNVRGAFSFGDGGGELLVKVGLSSVDVAGARRNLDAESPGWDFDAVRRAARERWNEELRRVDVEGGTADRRTTFYTALYHALLAPNVFSDVDGRYRGMDRQAHRAVDRSQYTVFSLWDTFRSAHPLYTLLQTRRTREFVQTFLAHYREGGRLPVWELAANETDTMIGYHAVPVIADAWVKGIRGFDERLALEAMIHSATLDHFGLAAYRRQGFIGSDDEAESVSRTLEYAYDDWCISRMAAGMGGEEAAAEFSRRSQAWRHLLDPATGFFRARVNQRWLEPFDPSRVDVNYTEANAWQYAFFVPHDLEGLIEALGGDERFIDRLDGLFEADGRITGRDQPDVTGLIGQYAHGNEPSHHMAWLYHYAGRPARSSERVRRILETQYAASPGGLSGNEDCGQMSAWYVLAATGLYQVLPCSDEYLITAPLFDRITVRLDGGRTFTIMAEGASEGSAHVLGGSLNGRPLERSFLRHGEIADGGDLTLVLGPNPDPAWGSSRESRPTSRSGGARVLAAPFARATGDRFRGKMAVELASAEKGARISYALNPGRSGPRWQPYRGPIVLTESARIRFRAEREGTRSPAVTASFIKIPGDQRVRLAAEPHPQYAAGGGDVLIDGARGRRNWRTGGWLGYQGTDFEATVDLGWRRPVRRAGAGFLQDAGAWIWMPVEVVVSVSDDGGRFREAARLRGGVSDRETAVVTKDLKADLGGIEARYVRILARGYGTIPEWHLGRGGKAFVFVDEILID